MVKKGLVDANGMLAKSPLYNGSNGAPIWKRNDEWGDKPKSTMERATDAALARAQQGQPSVVKIPEGFKPMEGFSEGVLPATKQPQGGGPWYYSQKRQTFFNVSDSKLYVLDPVSRMHVEYHESKTSDLRVSVGACFHEGAVQSRHIVVKDLAKDGFEHLDKPCSIYALYDGHRGAEKNLCVDYCVEHLHQKLMLSLASFRGVWDDQRLKATMVDVFQELDSEFAAAHPSCVDGCSAAIALIMGRRMVLASIGNIACVVVKTGDTLVPFKGGHVMRKPADDDDEDEDDDDDDDADGETMLLTRALGDLDYKQPTSSPRLSAIADVAVFHLDSHHRGVACVCRTLYNAIGRDVAVSTVFKRSQGRPRMASGNMLDAAFLRLGQTGVNSGLGSLVAFFESTEGRTGGEQKRQKVQPSQVRVRHILLKHRECKSTQDKVRNKQVTRSRADAERMLRAALEECEVDPKKSAGVFTQRCAEISECPTSSATGDLCGDLGWVKPGRNEQKFGPSFDAAAFSLQVGQLSDLIDSEMGIHIFIRAA